MSGSKWLEFWGQNINWVVGVVFLATLTALIARARQRRFFRDVEICLVIIALATVGSRMALYQ